MDAREHKARLLESGELENEDLEEAVSLRDREMQIRSAFERKFQSPDGEYWPVDIYENFVICRKDGRLFRTSYTVTGGQATFDDALVEVEADFTPVAVQSTESTENDDDSESDDSESSDDDAVKPDLSVTFREGDDGGLFVSAGLHEAEGDEEGWEWEVTVIRSGKTVERDMPNGSKWVREYPLPVLAEATTLFEGASVFAFSEKEHASNPGAKGVRDAVGMLEAVRMEGSEMRAVLRLFEDAEWLRSRLQGLSRVGKLEKIGLSIDAGGTGKWMKESDLNVFRVDKIGAVSSVDVVHSPAAGGKFNRLVASTQEDDMTLEEILALIRQNAPNLLESVNESALTMDQAKELLAEALSSDDADSEGAADSDAGDAGDDAANDDAVSGDEDTSLAESVANIETTLAQQNCDRILDMTLRECDLPEPVQTSLRAQFESRVFEAAELDNAINRERQVVQALFAQSAIPRSYGGDNPTVTQDERDKKIRAMEATMWGTQGRTHPNFPDELKDVTPYSGIRQAYRDISGVPDADAREIFFECQFLAPPFGVL